MNYPLPVNTPIEGLERPETMRDWQIDYENIDQAIVDQFMLKAGEYSGPTNKKFRCKADDGTLYNFQLVVHSSECRNVNADID